MIEPEIAVGRRRGPRWRQVAHGVHRKALEAPLRGLQATEDDGRHLARAEHMADLRAWQAILPPTACFTHLTAAGVVGLWLPPTPANLPVLVSMPKSRGAAPSRRPARFTADGSVRAPPRRRAARGAYAGGAARLRARSRTARPCRAARLSAEMRSLHARGPRGRRRAEASRRAGAPGRTAVRGPASRVAVGDRVEGVPCPLRGPGGAAAGAVRRGGRVRRKRGPVAPWDEDTPRVRRGGPPRPSYPRQRPRAGAPPRQRRLDRGGATPRPTSWRGPRRCCARPTPPSDVRTTRRGSSRGSRLCGTRPSRTSAGSDSSSAAAGPGRCSGRRQVGRPGTFWGPWSAVFAHLPRERRRGAASGRSRHVLGPLERRLRPLAERNTRPSQATWSERFERPIQ